MDRSDFTILVADDDDIAHGVITSILAREGYPTVSARNGLEAIEILANHAVKLVMTDLRMPGADGLEVLRQAVRVDPDVAVIIITGHGTIDETLGAMKEGAYDYLAKPFKVEEILLIAEKAYQRALLINQSKLLAGHLRGILRDPAVLEAVSQRRDPEGVPVWIERIECLTALEVLSEDEGKGLRERLVLGNGKGKNTYC